MSAGGTEVRESLNQYAATPLDLSSIPGSLTDSSGASELENALGPERLDEFELDLVSSLSHKPSLLATVILNVKMMKE